MMISHILYYIIKKRFNSQNTSHLYNIFQNNNNLTKKNDRRTSKIIRYNSDNLGLSQK
jgi:hypothetical protein